MIGVALMNNAGEDQAMIGDLGALTPDQRALLDAAPGPVLITEPTRDGARPRVLYVNQAFIEMTGWSAEDIVGRAPDVLYGKKTDRALIEEMRKLRSVVLRHPPSHIQRSTAYFLSLGHYDAQVARLARHYGQRAIDAIAPFPAGPAKSALTEAVEFAISRAY